MQDLLAISGTFVAGMWFGIIGALLALPEYGVPWPIWVTSVGIVAGIVYLNAPAGKRLLKRS